MKTGSQGIPLNCSIVVPVWHSTKPAMFTLHEKHNIENEWPNIQVQNKSVEKY